MAAMQATPISNARSALGMAVGGRAAEVVERTWEAARRAGLRVYSSAYDEEQRQSNFFGTLLIARWLVCGMAADEQEHAWLSRSGRLAVADQVPMARTVRGYFSWRDALIGVIGEEAARLGTPSDVVELALDTVRRSCDAALARMARDQDTHRENLAREVAASEKRFRGLYDAMACGVVLVDPAGSVIDCNAAAAAILGVTPEQLRQANLVDVRVPLRDESGRKAEPIVAEILRTGREIRGRVLEIESEAIRPRWVQTDGVPILDAAGELSEILLTYIDVTAVHDVAQAREESAAKSRFLATMSHELRTPLNSVLGFAQLVRMHHGADLDDRERRYLDNIETSGRHLLSLINDVLDLTKVAAGQLRVAPAEVPVADVFEEVERELQPQAAAKGIQLAVTVEAGLVVVGDPVRVRQVMTNLVSNAVKFTDAGCISLTARPCGGEVEIEVADTGIGIPADQLERVFDEFTQVEDGNNRHHEGTGLGLPLARRLSELMGGTLEITSRAGRGTRAVVRLPAAAARTRQR